MKARTQPTRLYSRAVITGFKRSKRNQYATAPLIRVEGVNNKEDAKYYFGKRVAYVYRAKREVKNSKFRVIWGKIRRAHGTNGLVRAKFSKNLPPKSFGHQCRVMMFPSNI
eukprot:GEMP01137771.1.p2 GENE.GEMP01137771.1~~GEMP01137771.1.p2  ORF type:complete len:122 (-),score=25.04 GEMP01137771.1:115-447(-)